jgi:hypothetical protein
MAMSSGTPLSMRLEAIFSISDLRKNSARLASKPSRRRASFSTSV